jgi:hypothetical protein
VSAAQGSEEKKPRSSYKPHTSWSRAEVDQSGPLRSSRSAYRLRMHFPAAHACDGSTECIWSTRTTSSTKQQMLLLKTTLSMQPPPPHLRRTPLLPALPCFPSSLPSHPSLLPSFAPLYTFATSPPLPPNSLPRPPSGSPDLGAVRPPLYPPSRVAQRRVRRTKT